MPIDLKDPSVTDVDWQSGQKLWVEQPGAGGIRQVPAGSAITRNVGTASGEIPVLDSNGQVPLARIPVSAIASSLMAWQTISSATGSVTINAALGYNIILNATGDVTIADITGKADGPAGGFIVFQQGSSTNRTLSVNSANFTTVSDITVNPGEDARTIFVWQYVPAAEGALATVRIGKAGDEVDGPVLSVNGASGHVIITGDQIRDLLEGLPEASWLSANFIADLPSGGGANISGTPTAGQWARFVDADEFEGFTPSIADIPDAGTMAQASTSDYIPASEKLGDAVNVATINAGGSTGDSFVLDSAGNLDPISGTDLDELNTFRTDVNFSAGTLTLDLGDADERRNYAPTAVTQNYTIANPTNQATGKTFFVKVVQDGTGGRTASFGTHFYKMFDTADIVTTAASVTCYMGIVQTVNTAGGILLFMVSK